MERVHETTGELGWMPWKSWISPPAPGACAPAAFPLAWRRPWPTQIYFQNFINVNWLSILLAELILVLTPGLRRRMKRGTSNPKLIFPPVPATQCSVLRYISQIMVPVLYLRFYGSLPFWGTFSLKLIHTSHSFKDTFFHITSHQGHYTLTEHFFPKLFLKKSCLIL